MGNTLTAILPVIHEAKDIVSREMVGFIPAVSRDASAERAALNQDVTYHIVPTIAGEDITPGANPADSGDQTLGSGTLKITKSRAFPIRWAGEEQKALMNGDRPQLRNVIRDQFAQAMRAAVNEVEADLAALYTKSSRAYGTAGTAPFGTAADLSDIAQIRMILEDNGAPTSDLQLVLSSAAIANLRGKQSILFKVNEAGSDELLRQGKLGSLEGFSIHNSAQVKLHTKGTGSGYLHDPAAAATQAIGTTGLHVDTGTGTILAGDVVTFAGDSNKYIIGTGYAGDGDGDIVLAKPGLRATLANDVAMTIGNNYRANLAFDRGAMVLVARTPALPEGGDNAEDITEITDEVSGLTFQVCVYKQYKRIKIEVGLAWGVACVKSEHLATLLG